MVQGETGSLSLIWIIYKTIFIQKRHILWSAEKYNKSTISTEFSAAHIGIFQNISPLTVSDLYCWVVFPSQCKTQVQLFYQIRSQMWSTLHMCLPRSFWNTKVVLLLLSRTTYSCTQYLGKNWWIAQNGTYKIYEITQNDLWNSALWQHAKKKSESRILSKFPVISLSVFPCCGTKQIFLCTHTHKYMAVYSCPAYSKTLWPLFLCLLRNMIMMKWNNIIRLSMKFN